MNDDTKKDIQSWKFVEPNDTAAQMNGFVNLEDLIGYVNDLNIDFDEVKIPIHYDQIHIEEEETFYFDSISDNNPNTKVLNLGIDSAYSDEMEMTVLEFLQFQFPFCSFEEIGEAIKDFNER